MSGRNRVLDSPVSLRGLWTMTLLVLAGLFSGFAYYGVICLGRKLLVYFGVRMAGI